MRQLLFIPGPVTVSEEVLAALARPLIDHRGPEFAALLERIEAGMKPIFATSGDVVVLSCSGTGGLEAAVSSAFSAGERVLAAPVGVFGRRLVRIARTWGIEVDEIETEPGAAVDAERLAARLRADTKHEFAGILLTHNETSTGVQNEMATLARAIGDHPALVVVDSVSGLGASDFRMDEWGFDIVVGASQKALAAPPGVAMVAVGERAWARIKKNDAPRFYLDLAKAREFAHGGQTPWTPPVSIFSALDAAIARYHSEGAKVVWERHNRNARAIRAAADALALELFSKPGAHSVTVVAMKVPDGVEASAIRSAMRERYGVVIGGGQQELNGKILRMGTMGALSTEEVLRGIDALEHALDEVGTRAYDGAAAAAAGEIFAGKIAA